MTPVVDASLALGWYFDDERTAATEAALTETTETGAFVPSLWRLEVANGLQAAIRRGCIDAAFRDRAIAALTLLPIVIDAETDVHAWTTTLGMSDHFGLSAYDAAYLELSLRRDIPLATLDVRLTSAARTQNAALIGEDAR